MELLKQAFDNLERNLERTVAEAASAVVESANEFPKPAGEGARSSVQLHISPAVAATQAKKAKSSWEDFDWQSRQLQWQTALQQLQEPDAQLSTEQLQQQLGALYEELLSLQDPVPAINAAAALAKKSAELEANCRLLQQDVDRLERDQAEFSQLLSNYNKEKEAHTALQAAHKALQEKLAATTASTQSADELEWTVKEQTATISSLQASLASLRAQYEASQASLFELTAAQEAAAGSVSTAEQLAAEELERLTAQLLQVRKERALLQRQLQCLEEQQQQQAAGQEQHDDAAADDDDRSSTVSQQQQQRQQRQQQQQLHGMPPHDFQVASLQAELEAAQEAARDQQHEVSLMVTKLAAAESRIERLTAELSRRPAASTVTAMAEQIAALSALLGQQLEAEGWEQDTAAAAVTAAGIPAQLEPLLLERCKRLEHALQAAKAAAADADQAATAAQTQLCDAQQQLQQSQALVKQLEADVLAMSCSTNSNTAANALMGSQLLPAASGSDAGVAAFAGNISGAGMDVARSSGALEAADFLHLVSENSSNAVDAVDASAAAAAEDGSSSAAALLAAVTGQRDRFRARITQLESEVADLTMQVQAYTPQNESLKQDNVALVEKLKFLQRYKQSAAAGRGGGSNAGHQSVTVIRVDGAGVIQGLEAYSDSSSAANSRSKAGRYSCGPISLDLGGGKGTSYSSRGTLQELPSAAARTGGVRSRQGNKRQGCFAGVLGEGGDLSEGLANPLDPEARYVKEYEARLNPFAAFQASESEARLKGMRLHDKAMLAANRLIAGSRMARAGLAVYFVLLHVFLMMLIYHSAMPRGIIDQEVSERVTKAVAAHGVDAITQARLAAAGSGVGDVATAGAGLRLLLDLLPRRA